MRSSLIGWLRSRAAAVWLRARLSEFNLTDIILDSLVYREHYRSTPEHR